MNYEWVIVVSQWNTRESLFSFLYFIAFSLILLLIPRIHPSRSLGFVWFSWLAYSSVSPCLILWFHCECRLATSPVNYCNYTALVDFQLNQGKDIELESQSRHHGAVIERIVCPARASQFLPLLSRGIFRYAHDSVDNKRARHQPKDIQRIGLEGWHQWTSNLSLVEGAKGNSAINTE